ncbi:hypothetical protein L2E82_17822 [Cichorium intybus]|uniref:Uncharacterized protein n=1 Tax=Cichorium intybus TaxID=13427 RepID=A0ACB9F9S7_CICIN|nr:hypothetical protein L2E82_17822 [Cichorium intybus]
MWSLRVDIAVLYFIYITIITIFHLLPITYVNLPLILILKFLSSGFVELFLLCGSTPPFFHILTSVLPILSLEQKVKPRRNP